MLKRKTFLTIAALLMLGTFSSLAIKYVPPENEIIYTSKTDELPDTKDFEEAPTFYSIDSEFHSYEKVNSIEEIQKYKRCLTKTYSESFFEDNFILFILITEGSGSISHEVFSVDEKSDSIDIVIKRNAPEYGTCDVVTRTIPIEISAVSSDKPISVLFTS